MFRLLYVIIAEGVRRKLASEKHGGEMAILSYERSYGTARFVYTILEVLGWIVIGVGLVLVVSGLSTGGIYSQVFGSTSSAGRIAAAIPGLIMVVIGLWSVAYTQTGKASVDNTEMTRELLRIARGQNSNSGVAASYATADAIAGSSAANEAPVEGPQFSEMRGRAEQEWEYKGEIITKRGRDYYIGDESDGYATLPLAKAIIDGRQK